MGPKKKNLFLDPVFSFITLSEKPSLFSIFCNFSKELDFIAFSICSSENLYPKIFYKYMLIFLNSEKGELIKFSYLINK